MLKEDRLPPPRFDRDTENMALPAKELIDSVAGILQVHQDLAGYLHLDVAEVTRVADRGVDRPVVHLLRVVMAAHNIAALARFIKTPFVNVEPMLSNCQVSTFQIGLKHRLGGRKEISINISLCVSHKDKAQCYSFIPCISPLNSTLP